MIVIALGAANFFGLMNPGLAGAVAVKAPPCGMACCVQGVCECQAIPADTPPPAPNAPLVDKPALKFVPMLITLLPVPVADSTTIPVLPPAVAGRGQASATPMFRLHCAMLM